MKAIAAMSSDRVIGYQGKIPWRNKLHMKFFKEMTSFCDLIVGNSTFKSVASLPNRHSIVLSNTKKANGIRYEYMTLNQLKKLLDNKTKALFSKNIWVIGGSKVYEQLLPICSDLYLSLILDDYEGDSYTPQFEHLYDEQRLIKEYKNLWIVHYWKRGNPSEEAYRDGFDSRLMGVENNPYTSKPLVTNEDWYIWKNWKDGWNEMDIQMKSNTNNKR